MNPIRLKGVRQNNLKNIDVEIQNGSFTVICGPSGSGKSSLAFETLYAEGQRRYIESMSSYARQFLDKSPQPQLDDIENIPPAIAIEQKNSVKTSRSTVGTVTEIIDYLRLLFAKVGIPYCPNHHTPVQSDTVSAAVDKLISDLEGERGYILTRISKDNRIEKGKKLQDLLIKDGFLRIYYKKQVIDLPTSKLPADDFDIVVDRLVFTANERGRIADSFAQAYAASKNLNTNLAGGRAFAVTLTGKEIAFSEDSACNLCGFSFPPISTRTFSFSSPVGACLKCNGFGNLLLLDEKKVIPNPSLTLAEGALNPFAMPSSAYDRKELIKFCTKNKIDMHIPWTRILKKHREAIWEGTEDFYGVKGFFDYLEGKKYKMHVRVFLSRYKSPVKCPDCAGSRLRKEVQHIFINQKNIIQLSQLTIEDLLKNLQTFKLPPQQESTSREVLKQLTQRLQFLIDVGVEYLTIDRETRTLSGGEYQRINLANQLGMGLSQTLYVLDEPTVGLHPSDNGRLIRVLKGLKNLGNTLVVVEHDKDVIRESDQIIELGPGSGHLGGEIMYSGPTALFLTDKKSLTAQYLASDFSSKIIHDPRPVDLETYRYKLSLEGCSGHNLKKIDIEFPLRRFVTVTGVSGSGKSSLVCQTLFPALEEHLTGDRQDTLPYKTIRGLDLVKNLVFIDQKPIGRSSRSNPASYIKVYDEIRSIMAATDEARERGLSPGYFSLNVDGGRCPDCHGEGFQIIDMAFMDDVKLLCDTCLGKRFRAETLEIEYRGKNISEILGLTVSEAMDFFINYPGLRKSLMYLKEVGLDYLCLGQSSATLSGGESQRLKIAKELTKATQNNTLYILDEPTTGLHPREVDLLLRVLNKLIDAGGSVIVIEHNLDVIRQSDYLIELGPQGGKNGGKILYTGTPQGLSKKRNCPTGPYLKPFFGEYQAQI